MRRIKIMISKGIDNVKGVKVNNNITNYNILAVINLSSHQKCKTIFQNHCNVVS